MINLINTIKEEKTTFAHITVWQTVTLILIFSCFVWITKKCLHSFDVVLEVFR